MKYCRVPQNNLVYYIFTYNIIKYHLLTYNNTLYHILQKVSQPLSLQYHCCCDDVLSRVPVVGPYDFLDDISILDNSSQTYSKSNQSMYSYFPPLTNWEPSIRERPLGRKPEAKGATKLMTSGPPGQWPFPDGWFPVSQGRKI